VLNHRINRFDLDVPQQFAELCEVVIDLLLALPEREIADKTFFDVLPPSAGVTVSVLMAASSILKQIFSRKAVKNPFKF